MPVIRVNSVVLPAPFGPMMALRSPVMTRNETSRVAFSPPKFFDRFLSKGTGTPVWLSVARALALERRKRRGRPGPGVRLLFAELAGREVLVVDGLRQELFFSVGPELIDIRIGLDDRVPELVLVVAEHLLLLDFLDVDVLNRVAHVVERHRPARSFIELDADHDLDQLFRPGPFSAGLLQPFLQPHARRVVILRVI